MFFQKRIEERHSNNSRRAWWIRQLLVQLRPEEAHGTDAQLAALAETITLDPMTLAQHAEMAAWCEEIALKANA